MLGKLYVEITDVCDLSCLFCPPTRREGAFMSPATFELLLGRLRGSGERLYLHVKGEPLLHPDLGALLETSSRLGFRVAFTTNGTRLAESAALLLSAGGLDKLSVSLHSHAGSPAAPEYWRGLERFLDLHRLTRPFPVSLRLWNLDSGRLPPETEPLWELLRGRYPAVGDWRDAASARDGAAGAPGRSPRRDSIELDERVYLNRAERFDWPDLALPQAGAAGTCLGLRDQIAVLVDGTVVPCCLDGEGAMALGNLRESSLGEILDAPRARAIRSGFARGELVEPLCRTCGYRRRFDRPKTRVD